MNKISRFFLVFVLTIMTVFAVSACTKKEDNQDKNTIMTEEPGIPLETYLNGNYRNIDTNVQFYFNEKLTFKPTKHKAKTTRVSTYGWAYFNRDNIPTKEIGKIKIYKYKNFEEMKCSSDHNSTGIINMFFETFDVGVWNGYKIEYSLSYYQNGKNIYTKNYHCEEPVSKNRRKFETNILKSVKDSGTYVFHIRYMTHILGHWDSEKKLTFKDMVFAFQIGDGDVLG